MAVLRIKVNCSSCEKRIDKAQALPVKSVNNEKRYECYNCYRRSKSGSLGTNEEVKVKEPYFCQRCKYKFKSKKSICPYCNKSDFLVKGKVTVHDLL